MKGNTNTSDLRVAEIEETIDANKAQQMNVTGTVVNGVITVNSNVIPGKPIFATDGGGWNWTISYYGGNWRFMGFSISGTNISHPANGERAITVIYLPSI